MRVATRHRLPSARRLHLIRLLRLFGGGFGLGLSALPFGGCSAVQTNLLMQDPPTGLRPDVELDATAFFAQTDYQCGPASLATALAAVGVSADPQVLADNIFLPSRHGSLQVEMMAGARRQLVVPTRIPGRLVALLRELAAGNVVVVLQNLGLDLAPVWHYAVAVGYSLQRQQLVLRSGVTRRQLLPMSVFESSWVRGGSWGFVVTPPGLWPVTAEESAAVEAAIGFERVAPPQLSQRVYASACRRWPDSLALQMGLGNSAFAAGNKVLAADSFESAARRHRSAAAWINLARTLLDADLPESAWRVALEAEFIDDPAWRNETTELLRDVLAARRLAYSRR